MDIKMSAAILAAKLTRLAIKLIGRSASSFPGAVALKLCPDILRRMTLPAKTVAITGSNGKTTTTAMLYAAAMKAGISTACNTEGSNQIEGVTAMLIRNSGLDGRVKADLAIIESDERFCQYTFKQFTPDYIVLTNLYRDQLTRNGHSGFVRKELAKGLPQGAKLIINADEPVSASLAAGRECIRYGVSPAAFCEKENTPHAYNDGAVCPVCFAKLEYDYHICSHVGGYRCPACGFARGVAAHEISGIEGDAFVLDGKYRVRAQQVNTAFAYDIAAAYTAAVEALGIAPVMAAEYLDGFTLKGERIQSFEIDGHRGLFTLTKHENSMAYNGALSALSSETGEATLVVIVDQLSRKYTANDMSWLWDIDFELAARENVRRVIAGGQFAHDLALRLIAAGVEEIRLTVETDLDRMMASLYENPVGDIYVMTCFTDVGKFTSRLKKEAGK